MKKFLLWFLGAVLLLGLAGFVWGWTQSKPRPKGEKGPAADLLARQMIASIDSSAWAATHIVSWNFGGQNQHTWDRVRKMDEVRWGDNRVLIKLDDKSGRAFVKGEEVFGDKKAKLLEKAWASWVNDSFWLNPVSKAFDQGTTREIVELESGKQGLLVSYSSGGVTPGDAYLWHLDVSKRPEAWEMWVSVIPVGGVYMDWSGWEQLSTGAWVSTTHSGPGGMDLKLTDIEGFASREAWLNGKPDPFAGL